MMIPAYAWTLGVMSGVYDVVFHRGFTLCVKIEILTVTKTLDIGNGFRGLPAVALAI